MVMDTRQFTRQVPVNEQQLTTDALSVADVPADALALTRPPLPQVELFPDRFGYGDKQSRTLGVDDVVNVMDRYVRYDFSGRVSGYEGSSSPSLGGF